MFFISLWPDDIEALDRGDEVRAQVTAGPVVLCLEGDYLIRRHADGCSERLEPVGVQGPDGFGCYRYTCASAEGIELLRAADPEAWLEGQVG
jgi:hypothetical protein